jgi:hypothetical protein
VQAIRAKNNGTAMMNGAALHANPSRFVFIGRRPTSGKRRKRDSTGNEKSSRHFKSKALEKPMHRESRNISVSKALAIQYGDIHDTEPRAVDKMDPAELDAKTITALRKKFGSNDKQEFSEGPEKASLNQTEAEDKSDEETVQISEDNVSEDLENAEQMHQEHVYREDEVKLGLWPLANVDDMYQALVMIAEGYSHYHRKLHTG